MSAVFKISSISQKLKPETIHFSSYVTQNFYIFNFPQFNFLNSEIKTQILAKLFTKLVLITTLTLGYANSASEKAKEFRDLCVIYKLLTVVSPEPKMAGIGSANQAETAKSRMKPIPAKIINLNLTTAEPQMTEALKAKKKYGTEAKLQEESSPVKNLFAGIDSNLLDAMIKDHNDMQENNEQLKAFNAEYGLTLSESKRRMFKPKLARLAADAEKINTEVTKLDAAITTTRLQTRKALLTVPYGSGAATTINSLTEPDAAFAQPTNKKFPWEDSSTRVTTCKKAT
uniref:Variant surface glycoprotein 1125.5553 n=1 Tax=Trypanosoma brucei TaxID=5691 RepID=A0A1J0RCL5_9TRYP|nr:variant surface glycoprotein 1125.5553 [Trypanosoma brucei]